MGWDSGFDDNGDAWLGGISAGLTDDLTLIYASTAGRFGENRFNGVEQGYMQSIVADYDINDCTKYIFQTDWLDTETEAGVTVRDTFGINQYLIRTVNDCLSYGARFEWWQVQADSRGYYGANSIVPAGPVPGDFDFYALTLGVNYRPHANLVFRPELRFDWVDGDIPGLAASDSIVRLDNFDDDQTTFGVDAILTF
jgi:hypothetical protein